MSDLGELIIQGIKEAVPRGQNINKVYSEQQENDESPVDRLEKLRKIYKCIWGYTQPLQLEKHF